MADNATINKARASHKKIIAEIAEAAGWDYDTAAARYEEAKERTGCKYKEYLQYKFYELDEAQQAEYFLMETSHKLLAKYDVDKAFVRILGNKIKTNEYFAEYIHRAWCSNKNISLKQFKKTFTGSAKIVYKPIGGHGGAGVVKYDINEDNLEAVYEEIISQPRGIVEEFITQHPKMNLVSSGAVNTIRFVTISTIERHLFFKRPRIDFAYAMLKMGSGETIADNLKQGGIGAAVDLMTGQLITNAVDVATRSYQTHPDTGTTIKGFEVPLFEEAKAMVEAAIKKKGLQGYLGWDIAITENGPEIIEVNTKPAASLLQLPYVEERKGMKYIMEKYL